MPDRDDLLARIDEVHQEIDGVHRRLARATQQATADLAALHRELDRLRALADLDDPPPPPGPIIKSGPVKLRLVRGD